MTSKIAVIGEFNETFEAHTTLNDALDYLKKDYPLTYDWVETDRVEHEKNQILQRYDGLWSAPGSPFKSLDGALYAITYARTSNIPHLGTCAGFQHAVIELARNLFGLADAQHEEYDETASHLFVSRLVCSLAGKTMEVYLKNNTLARKLYGREKTNENYYCNFGINPEFIRYLDHPEIMVSGKDQDGEIRIIELPHLTFFLVTLFVPQTRSKPDSPHPVIKGFVKAVCNR